MKIIFLDNDSVICLQQQWGGRFDKPGDTRSVHNRFDDFDKIAIKVLNSILEETGAEIVVSSDWRNFASLDELGDYYTAQGIIKRPVGVTPHAFDDPQNFPWIRDFNLEQHRSLEILQWLKEHPEVTHWVAVDDLDMSERDSGWGLKNFVHTPKVREGIKQSGIKEKIIKFL